MRTILDVSLPPRSVSLFYFELIYRGSGFAIRNKIRDRLATTPPTCERAEDAFICIIWESVRDMSNNRLWLFCCSSEPFALVECVVFIILPCEFCSVLTEPFAGGDAMLLDDS